MCVVSVLDTRLEDTALNWVTHSKFTSRHVRGVSINTRTDTPTHRQQYDYRIYIIKGVMSVCMLPMAGRTAGPIKTKLGLGTHVDPRSVLVKVKVKVIYLCVRYNRIDDSDTWRTTMNHARSSSSSSSSRCHLVNANKTPDLRRTENRSSTKPRSAINTADRGPQGRDNSLFRPEDGYLQLVKNKNVKAS